MKKYILILLITLFTAQIFSQGTTSGELLKLPAGGGIYGTNFISYTGYGSIMMSYFHPAALANIRQVEISTFYSNVAPDVNSVNLLLGIPFSENFFAALGYRQLSIGNIPRFDQVGQPSGTIDAGSYAIPFMMGIKLNSIFSLGFTMNYYSQILDNYSANAFAFSMGVQVKDIGAEGLSFLFSAVNFGKGLTFYHTNEKLPSGFLASLHYLSQEYPVAFFLQYFKYKEERSRILFGSEYNYLGQFFMRGGYQISDMDDKGWTVGIGMRFNNWSVSYDYIPSQTLSDRHGISLSFNLNPRKKHLQYETNELPPPENVTYVLMNKKLMIQWDYSLLHYPDVQFEVYIAKVPEGPWHKLPYKKLQSRSVEFSPQNKSFTLYFKIRAKRREQVSPFSEPLKISIKKK